MKLISCAALLLIAIPSAQSYWREVSEFGRYFETKIPYSGYEESKLEQYNPEQLEYADEVEHEEWCDNLESASVCKDDWRDPSYGHVGGRRLTKPNAAKAPLTTWGTVLVQNSCAKNWGDETITEEEAAKIAFSYGLKLGGGGYEFAGNASVDGPYKEYGLFWYKEGEYAGTAFFGLLDTKGKSWVKMRIEQQKSPTTGDRFRLPEDCVACSPGDFMISGECWGTKKFEAKIKED